MKYFSRKATPKNSITTPMRVSALPPVNHAHNRFARGEDVGKGGATALWTGGGDAAAATSNSCDPGVRSAISGPTVSPASDAAATTVRCAGVKFSVTDIACGCGAAPGSVPIAARCSRLATRRSSSPIRRSSELSAALAVPSRSAGIGAAGALALADRPPVSCVRQAENLTPAKKPTMPPTAAPHSCQTRLPTSAPTNNPINAAIGAAPGSRVHLRTPRNASTVVCRPSRVTLSGGTGGATTSAIRE